MSTVQELIDEFRETVRETDADNSHFGDAEIIRWLNVALNSFCVDNNLIIKEYSTVSVAGQRKYVIPSSEKFKIMLKVVYIDEQLVGSTRRQEDLNDPEWDDLTDRARPEKYFIQRESDGAGSSVNLVKAPVTSGDAITMLFVALPTKLTLTTQIPQIPEELQTYLVSYALARGYRKIKQSEVGNDYMLEYKEGLFHARNLANNSTQDLIIKYADQQVGRTIPNYRNPDMFG